MWGRGKYVRIKFETRSRHAIDQNTDYHFAFASNKCIHSFFGHISTFRYIYIFQWTKTSRFCLPLSRRYDVNELYRALLYANIPSEFFISYFRNATFRDGCIGWMANLWMSVTISIQKVIQKFLSFHTNMVGTSIYNGNCVIGILRWKMFDTPAAIAPVSATRLRTYWIHQTWSQTWYAWSVMLIVSYPFWYAAQ